MKILQTVTRTLPTAEQLGALQAFQPDLLLAFGGIHLLSDPAAYGCLRQAFPEAMLAGCSTAGEISDLGVSDASLVLTGLRFERTSLKCATVTLSSMAGSALAGSQLAGQLNSPDLRAVLVFGQGVCINGSALIEGMTAQLPAGVQISGGLAGDDGAFSRTLVLSGQGIAADTITAVGLYGDSLIFRQGSRGGWRPFGPARKITRCDGNVLYELDGKPALDIYKQYLGEYAKDLPGSGLLFPFEMLSDARESLGLIRTILGIDEANGGLILAGNLSADGYLRLMHAHTDDLLDGAEAAAAATQSDADGAAVGNDTLALLVSCVGRKLVMGGRVEEEVELVHEQLQQAHLCGFYSNGEISPASAGLPSCLHNQTMTITLLAEAGG